jgi:hypothetical protein
VFNEGDYAKSTMATDVGIATGVSLATSYRNYAASRQSSLQPTQNENYNGRVDPRPDGQSGRHRNPATGLSDEKSITYDLVNRTGSHDFF